MSAVVVVGAGIVGSSVAYHLARRGVPVTLLEQGPAPATGVTGDSFAWVRGSGGHWPGGAQDLHEYVLADYQRLEAELPHVAVRRTGSLSSGPTHRLKTHGPGLASSASAEATSQPWSPTSDTHRSGHPHPERRRRRPNGLDPRTRGSRRRPRSDRAPRTPQLAPCR
ncbi:FAD-dependent oxidoreductase [Streptomyces sp. NPDC058695]|uniref:FAD-dependent oxidoreductase n=1 Tax=Streptomyces sp. NPDC058695 TaxID=3346604 RepID=UPI0036646711